MNERNYNSQLIEYWSNIQNRLRQKLQLDDIGSREEFLSDLIGGMDISFIKGTDQACASFVVLQYNTVETSTGTKIIDPKDYKIIYESYKMCNMTSPYIAGFLAFREVQPLQELYDEFCKKNPNLPLRAIMLDGNGILHPSLFGLASHFGVVTGSRTIGVAKNLYYFEDLTDDRESVSAGLEGNVTKGACKILKNSSGQILGGALRTQKETNPVYVSTGHRCSLESALSLVLQTSVYKVPEPTRMADMKSREYLRKLQEKENK